LSSGHRREGPDFATRDRGRGEAIKKEAGKGEERERERERKTKRENNHVTNPQSIPTSLIACLAKQLIPSVV